MRWLDESRMLLVFELMMRKKETGSNVRKGTE